MSGDLIISAVSRKILSEVHPALVVKAETVIFDFEQAHPGDTIEMVQGGRNWAAQETLWLRGRDASGNVVDPSVVVTNAPPGHSWHEYYMALDGCPRSLLSKPGWDPESPLWQDMTAMAESHGLVCGACWHHKDLPHWQLTGRFPVSPTDEVREIYLKGGYKAVWEACGL